MIERELKLNTLLESMIIYYFFYKCVKFTKMFFKRDYLVEGMEIVEMYCDLLLARFGLVESMK
jgi:hypothetical protein